MRRGVRAQDVAQPRALGSLFLSSKLRGSTSAIDELHQSGCLRALFPNNEDMSATIINTAGGITGGDKLKVAASAGAGSSLTLTTQAAERAYKSNGETAGRLSTKLSVGAAATLHWLPQELILFDGAHFDRRLQIDLEPDASLLMVEPIVFGRKAMRERVQEARFSDQVMIRREGKPIYIDGLQLSGNIADQLASASVAGDAISVASVVLVRKDAPVLIKSLRDTLSRSVGISLLADDILSLRFLAADSFLLRKQLVPVLQTLRGAELPTSWRL